MPFVSEICAAAAQRKRDAMGRKEREKERKTGTRWKGREGKPVRCSSLVLMSTWRAHGVWWNTTECVQYENRDAACGLQLVRRTRSVSVAVHRSSPLTLSLSANHQLDSGLGSHVLEM